MESFDFPKRNRDEAHRVDVALLRVLESLLTDNEGISLRAIVRRLDGIGQPSSISRDPWRSRVVEAYQARQQELRHLMERADKSAKSAACQPGRGSTSTTRQLSMTCDALMPYRRSTLCRCATVSDA